MRWRTKQHSDGKYVPKIEYVQSKDVLGPQSGKSRHIGLTRPRTPSWRGSGCVSVSQEREKVAEGDGVKEVTRSRTASNQWGRV